MRSAIKKHRWLPACFLLTAAKATTTTTTREHAAADSDHGSDEEIWFTHQTQHKTESPGKKCKAVDSDNKDKEAEIILQRLSTVTYEKYKDQCSLQFTMEELTEASAQGQG